MGNLGGCPPKTGDGRLAEPGKTRVHDLSNRKKATQRTMYVGMCFARRDALRVERFILLKARMMWKKWVEAISMGLWRIVTSAVREKQASKELKPERELHWLG